MKHKTRTKALSWLLSLAMLFSLVPGMSLTAYADDPYSSLKNTTTVVHFDNKDWYLTDYDDSTVTLLSKECVGASKFYSNGTSNTYSGSTVENFVNSWYTSNISTEAQTAVSGSGMFLLTTEQANALSEDVRKCSKASEASANIWWLCSPCPNICVADVKGDTGYVNGRGDSSFSRYGVRPALKLNLPSVIFSSVNLSGGANATISEGTATQNYFDMGNTRGAMTTVTYTANANCKFPETSELYKTTNGITVTRTNDTVITVSGTPTATATSIAVPNAGQPVTGISLDKTTAQTIDLDGKVSFTATVAPDNPTDKTVKWSVNNDNVKLYTDEKCTTEVGTDATETLTVYAKGISAGSATVTATSNADSTKSATCAVTVHAHSFAYSVNGDTITATCGATDKEANCSLKDNNYQATLTIAAPTAGGGAAVLTGDTDAFGVSASNIKYYTKSGSDWTGETTTPPSGNGFYKAEITVGTTYTVSVTYGVNAITTDKEYSEETNHGTVTVPSVATANATVTINTTPAKGYELKTLTVKKSGDVTVTVTKDGDNGSFTMPEENVTVSAEFQKINYTISFDPMSNGTVAASKSGAPVSAENPANYQDEITLTITPDDGFALKSFSVKDSKNFMLVTSGAGNTRTFTMPAANVKVSATFEGAPYNLTISNGIIGGTVTASGGGLTDNGSKAKAGSEVTLTVTPAAGYQLETLKYNNTAITASNGVYKFTMPTEAVTVSATFVGKDTTVNLNNVTGGSSTCTASLLDSEYKKVTSLTKKAGEEFILSIDKDENYSYQVSFDPSSAVSMRGFSVNEYKAYINSTKSESLNTSLYWVTMPGVNADSVNMTVTFATAKTFTILYQPTTSANEVWVKFGYTENSPDKLVTAKMSKDAAMGNAAVWSLKMSAAFNPNKIAFATSESAAESADTQSATVSTTDSWSNITGGQYLIIGNNAKTVIAAFTDDSSSANANRDATVISIGNNAKYQIAICESGGSGSVTTPAAPTKDGYDFVAWRGYEGITAKDYAANTQISVKENMAFSAVWQPSNPKVKLDLNGGTGIDNTELTVSYEDNTTLPSLTPVKSGYSFAGWSVAKDVTEDGKLYTKGAPFDTGTKITADLELTAQWKHVHAYGCVQIGDISSLATKYAAYAPYLHIKICGCGDVDLEAHSLDSSGRCVCGYSKSGATPTNATLDVSYVRQSDNHTMMAELPETVAADSEVSVSAPGKWGNLTFSKWQYRAKGDVGWTDAGAYKMMSFVIPGNMEMRALYVNATAVPEVSMSATTYATTAANMDGEFNSILFQMNYKLPDGYTYVDAGVRSGDNAGISYYELKERTATMDAEAKAITYSLAAAMSVLSGELTTFDTSGTEQYYAKRENSVLEESGMTAAKLGEYMYQSKPINIKDPPLYWNYKPTVTGQSGSINALTPVGFAQRNDGNHYIYAIAYLTYKDRNGTTHTIYTDALPATVNILLGDNKPAPVSRSGS